jgi:hypothetical protein
LYCQHCSLMAKSKYGSRSLAWPRSFLSPTAKPLACARLAIDASNCSYVAALIVSPAGVIVQRGTAAPVTKE